METLDIHHTWEPVTGRLGVRYRFLQKLDKDIEDQYQKAAIYRWVVLDPGPWPSIDYMGQTENLFRRIGEYLSASDKRSQTYRVKAELERQQAAGAEVELWILRFAPFQLNGELIDEASLADAEKRQFMEAFAFIVRDRVHCTSLNHKQNALERRLRKAQRNKVKTFSIIQNA